MGNTSSTEPIMIDVYNWSSLEFPREYALIYTSLIDRSRFSIYRLSSSQDRVLCRLADSLCHDHPIRLHMEATAERDHNGYFSFGAVRVVVDGIPAEYISFREEGNFTSFGGKSCSYGGTRDADIFGYMRIMNWDFFHCYSVSFMNKIKHHTNIQCDRVRGLVSKLTGPIGLEEVIHGEPPKAFNGAVEREFKGKEYILFQQEGRGNGRSEASGQGTRVVVNSGGEFAGHGNGAAYYNCHIVMKYKADKGRN